MAVLAFDEVNVVGALCRGESGVHFFDIEAAIGEARMTGGAGRARVLAVLLMAGQATETFVDADGRAVIAGMHFPAGKRRVALVAESLSRIGADLHRPAGFDHYRQRKKSHGEADAFTAIEETQGGAIEFFAASEFGLGIVVILFL